MTDELLDELLPLSDFLPLLLDDELDEEDFCLMTGGTFSDSLELLEDLCLGESVLGGISGIVTAGVSLSELLELSSLLGSTGFIGSSLGRAGSLLEELLEDFLLLGESTGFGTSGTLASLSELESDDFFGEGITGDFLDELDSDLAFGGCSGTFFLDELEDDELSDFFLSTGGRDSESLELSGFSCGTIGSTLVSGTFDDELDFLSELDFDLGASGFAGTEGFSADFLEDELDDELLDFFLSTGGRDSESLELSCFSGALGSTLGSSLISGFSIDELDLDPLSEGLGGSEGFSPDL